MLKLVPPDARPTMFAREVPQSRAPRMSPPMPSIQPWRAPLESNGLRDLKRVLVQVSPSGTIALDVAARVATAADMLATGALDIRISKDAEAVQAWARDHTAHIDQARFSGRREYPIASSVDLKQAATAAGAALDAAALAASGGVGMLSVTDALYRAAKRDILDEAPVPRATSFLEFLETRPRWQVAAGTMVLVGVGYLLWRGVRTL